jgi:hypothetical protein
MLVPLETLSGWPRVENPSALQLLWLLIGIPLLIAIVVAALIKMGAARHARRGDNIDASDPLWVGNHESAEVEAASANPGSDAGDEAAAVTAGADQVQGDDTGEHVGGAGARW